MLPEWKLLSCLLCQPAVRFQHVSAMKLVYVLISVPSVIGLKAMTQ